VAIGKKELEDGMRGLEAGRVIKSGFDAVVKEVDLGEVVEEGVEIEVVWEVYE